MLNGIIDAFILNSPQRGNLTFPRSNIYISGIVNYLSLWLKAIPNTASTLKGTMDIINILSVSDISRYLNSPMSEQYNKVYNRARQLASIIDTSSKEIVTRSTFVNGNNTEEYIHTCVSSLSDHTDSWSYWKSYLPLRLVSTDLPIFVDNFLSGKLIYQNISPGFVVFNLDVVGLALKYASFLNRPATIIPPSERGRVISMAEFVNAYVLFPCFAYDTLNLWLLDNYKRPYFSTRSHKLSAVGGALAARSEIDTLRDDLTNNKISPSAFVRDLRFADCTKQVRGSELYNTLYTKWDPVVTGRQSAGVRVLSRYNWYNLVLDTALAHGPEYQAMAGDLYLAADQGIVNSIDIRVAGSIGKKVTRDILQRCKETGAVLKQ